MSPRARALAANFIGWTALGLISSGLTYANWTSEGLSLAPRLAFIYNMPFWMLWALLAPAVVWAARRWPPVGPGAARRLLVHLLLATLLHTSACAVTAWTTVTGYAMTTRVQTGSVRMRPRFASVFISNFTGRFPYQLMIYAGIVAATVAFESWRRLREREVHASRLEAQLAQAQLSALRMQLNPHFLFNTLQAISSLTVEDPHTARRMLVLLGDLLRGVLEGEGRQLVPLRDELAFLQRYLDIERIRFPDRLLVRTDVEPAAQDLMVPSLLLQPLVENAIRYAIAPRADPGTLGISARRDKGRLVISVTDDGPGPPAIVEEGVGLSSTRERLQLFYGADHRFELRRREGGGAEALIELPGRTEADAPAS